MANFELTQTGEQVQQILNDAPTEQDVAEVAADLVTETTNRETADTTLQGNIDAEETARENADSNLQEQIDGKQPTLTFDFAPTEGSTNPVYSGAVKSALDQKQDILTFDNEPTQHSSNPVKSGAIYDIWQALLVSIAHNAGDIDTIEGKIPADASSINQLADKAFVNSSISTNTATFRGTSAAGLTEAQFLAWANGLTHDKEDYVFWNTTDAAGTVQYKRYKYNGSEWLYEYTLNNSSFTSAQWAAINSAITSSDVTKLAALPTRAQLDAMMAGINSAIGTEEAARINGDNALNARVLFAEKSFGKYSGVSEVTLSQVESGKYINTVGTTTSASGYGISNSFNLNAGDILLVPSAQAVPASVSVVARIVTRTFQKVIAYAYTYRQDYPELPLTATADYDNTLVYTAVYDETGETPTLTGWTIGGTAISELPGTHEVTESYYEPLVRQSVSAMPSTGYYIYLCPTPMTVVVSGLTATVNGGVCQIVGWGIFKNICSNFVGAPGQAVIAQAFAQMKARLDGMEYELRNPGTPDFYTMPTIGGQSQILFGEGAPSVVPMFIGQRYHDTTNKKIYEAMSVTNSTADWVLLN